MEEEGAKQEDEDEGEAHEGVGDRDFELGHGRHPEEGGDKGGDEAGEEKGVKKRLKEEQQFVGELRREVPLLGHPPFDDKLAVHREEDAAENVEVVAVHGKNLEG